MSTGRAGRRRFLTIVSDILIRRMLANSGVCESCVLLLRETKNSCPGKIEIRNCWDRSEKAVPVVPPGLMIGQITALPSSLRTSIRRFCSRRSCISGAHTLSGIHSCRISLPRCVPYNISGCPQTPIRSGTVAAAIPPSATLCVPCTRSTHSSSAVLFCR